EYGAGARPKPGAQPQATSLSFATWSAIASIVENLPVRAGSLICAQISALVLPNHCITSGARCQLGAPGGPCGRSALRAPPQGTVSAPMRLSPPTMFMPCGLGSLRCGSHQIGL